jgi:peptide deformylase
MPDRAARDSQFAPPRELEAAWSRHPEILKLGDPVLRQVASPVMHGGKEVQELIERMTGIMQNAFGLGLAAPQVGALQRVVIYKMPEEKNPIRVLINPKIIRARGEQVDPAEGCLSIPGLQARVCRAAEVRVKAFDRRMRPITIRAEGLEARVIQHELDHLDGILFIDEDRADSSTFEWMLVPEDEDEEAPALRE